MAVICPYNTKCKNCRHHRYDTEEGRMACFYTVDFQTNQTKPNNNKPKTKVV